jgi:hypothetical protein
MIQAGKCKIAAARYSAEVASFRMMFYQEFVALRA